jgi:hypothetical protein
MFPGFILENIGRNSTMFLCTQIVFFPALLNRFFFNEQSHKSFLKILNSSSVSDKFLTWSATHKGEVFVGIFGANI